MRHKGWIAVAVDSQKCLIHHVAPLVKSSVSRSTLEIHLFSARIEADQIDEAVLSEGQGPIESQTGMTLDTTDYVDVRRVCVSLVKSGT